MDTVTFPGLNGNSLFSENYAGGFKNSEIESDDYFCHRWMTQWIELKNDPEMKIYRPRQRYVGVEKRKL